MHVSVCSDEELGCSVTSLAALLHTLQGSGHFSHPKMQAAGIKWGRSSWRGEGSFGHPLPSTQPSWLSPLGAVQGPPLSLCLLRGMELSHPTLNQGACREAAHPLCAHGCCCVILCKHFLPSEARLCWGWQEGISPVPGTE